MEYKPYSSIIYYTFTVVLWKILIFIHNHPFHSVKLTLLWHKVTAQLLQLLLVGVFKEAQTSKGWGSSWLLWKLILGFTCLYFIGSFTYDFSFICRSLCHVFIELHPRVAAFSELLKFGTEWCILHITLWAIHFKTRQMIHLHGCSLIVPVLWTVGACRGCCLVRTYSGIFSKCSVFYVLAFCPNAKAVFT